MDLRRWVPTRDSFQMQSMKVICDMKSNMNEQFNHDEELTLM
jgi:hypothetical protein